MNFMAGNWMGTIGTDCQEGTEMARKNTALLVDVLADAGVEKAYDIRSLQFRELPAFCGMFGNLMIGKNNAWNMSPQQRSRPRYCCTDSK
jgi:hypothetical protein